MKAIKLKRPVTADSVRRAVKRGMLPCDLLRKGYFYLGRTSDGAFDLAVWSGHAFYCLSFDGGEDGDEVHAKRMEHPVEVTWGDDGDDLSVTIFAPVAEVKPTWRRKP